MATPTTQSTNGQYTAQGTPINGAAFTNPFASQINAQAGTTVNGVGGQVGVTSGTQNPAQYGAPFNAPFNGQYGPYASTPSGAAYVSQSFGQPGFGFPVNSPFGVPFNATVNVPFNATVNAQHANQFGGQFGGPYPTITGGLPTLPFGSANTPNPYAYNPFNAFNTVGAYPIFNPFTGTFTNTFNAAFNPTGFYPTGNAFYGVNPFIAATSFAQFPFAGVPFGTTGFNGVTPFSGVPFYTPGYTGQFNTIPSPLGWNSWATNPAFNIWNQNAWSQNPWNQNAWGQTTPAFSAWNAPFNSTPFSGGQFNNPWGGPSTFNPSLSTFFNTTSTPWTTGFQNAFNAWNAQPTWNASGNAPSIFGVTPWNSIPGAIGVNPWTPTGGINSWPGSVQFGTPFGTQNCNVLGGDCACPPNVCIPGFQSAVPFAGIQNSGAYGLPYNSVLPTGVSPLATGFNTVPTPSNVLGANPFGTLPRWTSLYPQNTFSPNGVTPIGGWQNAPAFSPFNPFNTFNQSAPLFGNSTLNPYAPSNTLTSPVPNAGTIGYGTSSPIFGTPSLGVPSHGIPAFNTGYVQTSPTGSVLTSVAGGVNALNASTGFPYASNPNNPFVPSSGVTNQVSGHAFGTHAQSAGASLVGCCREAA